MAGGGAAQVARPARGGEGAAGGDAASEHMMQPAAHSRDGPPAYLYYLT